MHCLKKVTDDLFWVGANDRRLAMFEGVYSVPGGVSYNSYLLMDEKTVLFDTVDKAVKGRFLENVSAALEGRALDYLVVQHVEPDHSAAIEELLLRYPGVKLVCNAKSLTFIKQFFNREPDAIVVKEGETLSVGKRALKFMMAPMVHWPEVMVTYDATDKILFSADAFGCFGALNGALFADEVDFEKDYMDEARRYYANIVGKYGTQTQALLHKASALEINMICPLHGFVWRRELSKIMGKYALWGGYLSEETGVMIAYASVYGNTENAAEILACRLRDLGVKTQMFDVSVTHASDIVAAAFRWSHLVFASTTYNAGIFVTMEALINDLTAHNIQNRMIAVIENGSWAPTSGALIREKLERLKNIKFIGKTVSVKSGVKEQQLSEIEELAQKITAKLTGETESEAGNETPAAASAAGQAVPAIDAKVMFKLSYGLFILTAKDGEKDNGCVINTATQITDKPLRISVAVNKANYTGEMILKTGAFNLSILSESAPFALFRQFGFQSGRDADKFAGGAYGDRAENGIRYIPEYTNGVISARVFETRDYGTHTVFFADVTQAFGVSGERSATYQYYFDYIKPKPQPPKETKKGFVCKICGYVHEGETLPEDFICPLCKHGAQDFEPIN
ncbi:MAG: flavin reductase [Clostridiales bacterium]|jgi:flavorubredoxin/flavin reductase (DIM6/NTAB) family NADH-FMN oxidoreductase RutF/rubredoxin|nr:flavin reductase [Clostridiales bacterium]